MPVMDGYTSAKEMREFVVEQGIDHPIIVAVTGHVEEKYIKRSEDAGMNTLLPKPV